MKKHFLSIIAALMPLCAVADDGMWLPNLISARIADMQAKGFRLSAEDIYSVNQASLKDAVVRISLNVVFAVLQQLFLLLVLFTLRMEILSSHLVWKRWDLLHRSCTTH